MRSTSKPHHRARLSFLLLGETVCQRTKRNTNGCSELEKKGEPSSFQINKYDKRGLLGIARIICWELMPRSETKMWVFPVFIFPECQNIYICSSMLNWVSKFWGMEMHKWLVPILLLQPPGIKADDKK